MIQNQNENIETFTVLQKKQEQTVQNQFELIWNENPDSSIEEIYFYFNDEYNLANLFLQYRGTNNNQVQQDQFDKLQELNYKFVENIKIQDKEDIRHLLIAIENENIKGLQLTSNSNSKYNVQYSDSESESEDSLIRKDELIKPVNAKHGLCAINFQKFSDDPMSPIIYAEFFFDKVHKKNNQNQKNEDQIREEQQLQVIDQQPQAIAILTEKNQQIQDEVKFQNCTSLIEVSMQQYQRNVSDCNENQKNLNELKDLIPIKNDFNQITQDQLGNYKQLEEAIDQIENEYNQLSSLNNDISNISQRFMVENQFFYKKSLEIVETGGVPQKSIYEKNIQNQDKLSEDIQALVTIISQKKNELHKIKKQLNILNLTRNIKNFNALGNSSQLEAQIETIENQIKEQRKKHSSNLEIEKSKKAAAEAIIIVNQNLLQMSQKQQMFLQQQLDDLQKSIVEFESKQQGRIQTNQKQHSQREKEIEEQIQKIVEDNNQAQLRLLNEQDTQNKKFQDMLVDQQKRISQIKTSASKFHFIYCFDESGSMIGDSWNILRNCAIKFIENRKSMKCNDRLSVILFDSQARLIIENEDIQKIKPEDCVPSKPNGGGTDFECCFSKAESVIDTTNQGFVPVILFLTDGQGNGSYKPILQRIYNKYKIENYFFIAIGLGKNYDNKQLDEIAKVANGGSSTINFSGINFLAKKDCQNQGGLDNTFNQIKELMNSEKVGIQNISQALLEEQNKIRQLQSQEISQRMLQNQQLIDSLIKQKKLIEEESKLSKKDQNDFYENEIQKIKVKQKEMVEDIKKEELLCKDYIININQNKKKIESIDKCIQENEDQKNIEIEKAQNSLKQFVEDLQNLKENKKETLKQLGFTDITHYNQFQEKIKAFDNLAANQIAQLQNLEQNIQLLKETEENPDLLQKAQNPDDLDNKINNAYKNIGIEIHLGKTAENKLNIIKHANPQLYKKDHKLIDDLVHHLPNLSKLIKLDEKKVEKEIQIVLDKYIIQAATKNKKIEEYRTTKLENEDLEQQLDELEKQLEEEEKKEEENKIITSQMKKDIEKIKKEIKNNNRIIDTVNIKIIQPVEKTIDGLFNTLIESLKSVYAQGILKISQVRVAYLSVEIQQKVIPALQIQKKIQFAINNQ